MPRFIIVDGVTIQEIHDGEEVRPKKRQRVDDSDDDQPVVPRSSAPSRDSIYYYSELDDEENPCVIQVENTLFKVSESMFPLGSTIRLKDRITDGVETPTGNHRNVGGQSFRILVIPSSQYFELGTGGRRTTDKEPLLLLSASADEFRALLWALSIPEKDLDAQLLPTEESHIHNLLELIAITNTYSYTSLRDTALHAIECAFTSSATLADACASTTFASIIEVSVNLGASALQTAVTTRWIARLRRRDIPAPPAIAAANGDALRRLRGIAYYTHAQELLARHPHVAGPGIAQLLTDSGLDVAQTVCLLAGCMALVTFWERLCRKAPKLPCAMGCGPTAHRACVATWNERWHQAVTSEKVLGHGSSDVLAILNTVRERLALDQELVEKLTPACRKGGLGGVERIAADLLQDLPNYFPTHA